MSLELDDNARNELMRVFGNPCSVRSRNRDMLKAIRANRARLDACPKHRFELSEPPYHIGQDATCVNCHGEMKLTQIDEYVRGYRAAGGNPCDIVPNWE